jgi:lipopolysaccharide assembly protein A
MRWVFWIIVGLIAILAANFAVWNGAAVALDLWPLPVAFDMPAYLTVLAPLALGILLGWLASWVAHLPARRARKRLTRHTENLETELSRARAAPAPGRSLVG